MHNYGKMLSCRAVLNVIALCGVVISLGDGASLSHPGHSLQYITTVESSVFDQESINSTIKFLLEPLVVNGDVSPESWHLLRVTSMVHLIKSHGGEVSYPSEVLRHDVYFSSSPSGVIQRVYHHKEDPEDLVHVKKYLLSALSGHLQEDSEEEWEYVLEEQDHAGKGHHYYRAKRSAEGTEYHRKKRLDPNLPHLHEKKFTVDHEGKITSVHSHENLVLFNDHLTVEGDDPSTGHSDEHSKKIESKIYIRLFNQRALGVVKELTLTELGAQRVRESLELNMEEERTFTLEEATHAVQRGLECSHRHRPESSQRAKCVLGIRKAVNGLMSADLGKLAQKFIGTPCALRPKAPHHCQQDRDTLIDVVARVDSPEAQRVVIKVLREGEETEVQRCLFHLTASTQPIKEVVEIVAGMCFGDGMKNHGILHLHGNHKRACLTLGALLHHHVKVDSQRTEELLQHLHTWLDKDSHLEHNFESDVLRDPREVKANKARQRFVHAKTVLLHVLGNAGLKQSRNVIANYAQPNTKHADLRHTAMKALRHFTCKESATVLLNATINDGDVNVKSAARHVYMEHPRAGELSHTDQNILISKEPRIIHQLREKRSILCNLIDKLTLDYRIDFRGFDWSKKVGNDFIGASFGVKMIKFAHMHSSPVTMFFELNIDNRAWIESWVKLFKKRKFDIFNAEVCFKRAFRMYNISTIVDFNVVDILKEYERFDELYEEVVQPLIDSVNSFSDLLDVWNDTLGHIDLGLGVNDMVRTLMEKEDNITAHVDRVKEKGEEWVNDTFGGVMEFVQEVKEIKADVINRVEEINDTVRVGVQEFAENVQSHYEEAILTVEDQVNEYLESLGVDFELQFLDECLATVDLIELIKEPEETGEEVVACLKDKVNDRLEEDVGLMGQVNKVIRTVRQMQEKFQNITDKIEKVKLLVEDVKDNGWKVLVKKLLERHQGFVDEMATGMLNFINGILDDMGMNLQHIVNTIDKANRFIENAVKLIKDAPNGAIADITRGQLKMRLSQVLFEKLKERFELDGSELQGKIASWMETGMELKGLIRGLKSAIEKLQKVQDIREVIGNVRSAGSIRDKLEMLVKESSALEGVTPLLEELVGDLESLKYTADEYKDSFTRVVNGMKKAKENFENLKRRAETAKELIQKVFGIKFHKAYPNQVKTECDDNCGGCGIYPNVMRGRRGVQLLAERGRPIVTPFDARVVPLEGSSDELMLYPLGADMNDYEIIVTFIKPVPEIFDYPDGLFADAGVMIGEAIQSPCQPNFIHTAIRKLNSTVQSESSSPFGIEKGRTVPRPWEEDACGSKDWGEYVPTEEFYDTPDPMPKYLEGCSKAEFKHIFQYFDLVALAVGLDNFTLDWEQLAEEVGGRLSKQLDRLIEFPPVDGIIVDQIIPHIEKIAMDFSHDLISKVNQQLKNIKYKFDGLGNWVRDISFNLPENIPKISDFFSTMNFTVDGFGQFLLDAGLNERFDKLMGIVGDLGSLLDGNMCEMLSKMKPPKLRWETLKDGGSLNRAKDVIKGQMEKLKMKGCDKVLSALGKSESHFCEVEADSSCNLVQCITQNRFDDKNIEIPVGIGFDPCNIRIKIGIGVEEVTVDFDEGNLITTVTLSVAQINHINITAEIRVEFDIRSKNTSVDVVLKGCHTLLPVCFGYSPVFKNLQFEITMGLHEMDRRCLNISRPLFPCQNDSSEDSFRLQREVTEGQIRQWKMEDFLYSLDRFNLSRGEVNSMLDESRVAVLQKLTSLTSMKSSIHGKELFRLPDLKTEDKIKKGPFDIPFFNITFQVPLLSLTIEAGGAISVGLDMNLKILSSNATITQKPSIAGYAEADGKISLVVTAVGLKLRGTLLETIFNLIVDFRWPQYPIEVVKTLRVDLIPLGIDFKGYWKILGIPLEITIFTWKAPLMKGNPHITKDLVHDETAPQFEWQSNTCLVEQVLARHWSDPAFFLEAPFYDPESVLHIQYAIGTYRDGTDVLGWADMEGVSMIVPIQLRVTGLPLHFTIKATNTDNKQSVVHCVLDTYDVTPATGRFEAAHVYTSHPSKLSGTLMVIEDSPLVEEQYTGVGVGRGYYGDQMVHWYLFDLDKDPINKEGEGELAHFAAGRQGRLTSPPIKSITTKYDHECAKECNDLGDGCASFDFDYSMDACDLHWTIEGKVAELVLKGAYHNFEKLGAGYTAYFSYEGIELIQAEAYYLNARITNVRGYESYLTSHEIVVDFTCPEPGPIGDYKLDVMRHDDCSAAITHGERCIEVTPNDNHRHIIDGPGASTVFNGNFPRVDLRYTISNHYLTANWDGFHDDETDIWGYTWAAGTSDCGQDVQEWDDPHSHLADSSYWTHQGLSSDLLLQDGPYFVTVQALNSVVFGGALVTSVCHSTPIIVDTTAPRLDFVEDIFYDEDFDLLGVYYKASDPESGIMRTDIGLGETKHDVFVRAYSHHDPLHDGYEMVSVDGVDLPLGVAVWVRVRVVNSVEMLTADHAKQPLMMDPTPPVAGSVLDGDVPLVNLHYQPQDDRMCVQWYDWYDAESGIERFLWGIGTSENTTDVMEFVEYSHYERSACTDIALNHSATYYNVIKAYNQAINSRASQKASDGVKVDITEPLAGWVHDGQVPTEDIAFSSQAASLYSHWGDFQDPESGIEEYVVTLSVNGEDREEFVMSGDEEYLEDHTQHLKQADFVQITVEAKNRATLKNQSESTGYVIDLTPPDVVFLRDHPRGLKYQVSDSEVYAHWKFEDPESQIKEYRLRILENKAGNSYQMWPEDTNFKLYVPAASGDTEFEETIEGLALDNGVKYSLEVTAINRAELVSKQDSLGVIVDTTPPVMSKVYIGSFGADEDLNDESEVIHDDHHGIQASWVGYDHESGIIRFMVAVGSAEGDTSVSGGYRDFGTEPEAYIDGILLNVTAETGELYYVSIYAVNGAGVHSDVITSRPIHVYGENTPGIVYDGRYLYVDKDYSTDTVTVGISFQGFASPACGIRGYEWALGSQPGYSDILPYTSYGIVMLNESHAITEVHLPLQHGDMVYASVRAHTGHRCKEDILHSCSDGILIDTQPPDVSFVTLGQFGNDTDADVSHQGASLFQTEYDSIALTWNTTDEAAGALNDTWMAGSLPLEEDKHPATVTTDTQIPIRAVTMEAGETVIFSVIARDRAGNVREAVAPPLTVDVTEPVIEGFKCTEYMSPVQTELSCTWTRTLDPESPLVEQRLAVGDRQLQDQIVAFETVPYGHYSWKRSLETEKLQNKSKAFVSLQVANAVGLVSSVIARLTIDTSAPDVGQVAITTPVTPGEVVEVKVCQQSVTTMEVRWENFDDKESGILSYEVGIGTGPSKSDISIYKDVGSGNSVFLDKLPLIPGTQAFASVRAVNNARLVSGSVSTSVHISPRPRVLVWDGLGDTDLDYQNDLSSLSGKVKMDQPCPILEANWWAFDLLGNEIVNQTEFYNDRFANDELRLMNFHTYYTVVEIRDAINRTLMAKSDGVLTFTEPPRPGEVRDGPYPGEDRNYQESTEELSVNWDPFGSGDDPLEVITHYQVALGDNPGYAETRTNVHYFVDVGLSLNYTFVNLRLTPKRVQYFSTVRGYSESGAHVDSVSNGIKVGYSAGMEVGEVHLSRYSNSSNSLSFYWDRYVSDFRIIHYRWGIGNTAFPDDNVTLPCSDLLPLVENWAMVQPLVDEKQDRFADKKDLKLDHAKDYYLVVIAEDEASQCISSLSRIFTVDMTPPDKSIIKIDGIGTHVQYTTSRDTLRVSWEGYKDDESGISDFYLQLFNESDCFGSDPETWTPISDSLDVKNTDHHTYMAQDFKPDIPYRILITVMNEAGSVTIDWSKAIFLDTTAPEKGVVKDGSDWTQTKYYQSSTSDLEAVFAVSPLGSTLDCPLTRLLVPVDESNRELWYVMDGLALEDPEGAYYEDIYLEYHARNVHNRDDGSLTMYLHYNISTLHLEGGSMMTDTLEMLEGDYTFKAQIRGGEHSVFSITMSDGFMDEYVDFDLPVVEDQPTDEEFFQQAKDGDLDFDRGLDVTLGSTANPPKHTTAAPRTTTEENVNITEPDYKYRDGFDSNALGVHFLGFPAGNKTKVWTLLFWARDTEGIKYNWIYLTFDPTQEMATYSFEIERDYSTIDIRWNVIFNVNGERLSEMLGINLPYNYTTKIRYWSHDKTLPEFVDPFNPYFVSSVMKDFSIPVPRERPCQFGKAFYDMESAVQQIYIGVGNTSHSDNIVPYYLAYGLCHSCHLPCDHYKCADHCQPDLDDGYLMLTAHLTNLTLDPGDLETEEQIFSMMGLDQPRSRFSDYEVETNDTAYMSNRYYILVKAVSEAGLETISVSPGIQIDTTPPVLVDIAAIDPEYDPMIPTEYQWSNSSLGAWWDFDDKESPMFEYRVAIGTSPNATDIAAFSSVGTQTSVTISDLEGSLKEGHKYYLTIEGINAAGLSTFVSTSGVIISTSAPDVSNSTSEPLNSVKWPAGDSENAVYITDQLDQIGISFDGILSDDVHKLEWGTGESRDDTFITSPVEVDRRLYDWSTMEIRRDGFFWFGNEKSDTHLTWLSQKAAQINMTLDSEYIDPGSLLLEPGRCVYHHLYAQNMAHMTSLIDITPVCTKRSEDYVVVIIDAYQLDYTSDKTTVTLSGNGVGGVLYCTAVDRALYEAEYSTSANITFRSYIVNPQESMKNTSRVMSRRLVEYTDIGVLVSPFPHSDLTEPLQMTLTYTGVTYEPANQSLAILYWDTALLKWFNVEESSGRLSVDNSTAQTITGWFAGPVEEDSDLSNRSRRSTPDEIIYLTSPHMFALYIVDGSHQNSPPVLLTKNLITERDSTLSTQLLYFDPEEDQVEFSVVVEPRRGTANLSSEGWLVYEPYPLYFGPDVMTVSLNETGLPDGLQGNEVEETIQIDVRETPVAPVLFLQLNEELAEEGTPWRIFTETVTLQFEANTTLKSIGTLHVCDFNPEDNLELLWQNEDPQNVSVEVTEIRASSSKPGNYKTVKGQCMDYNVRTYRIGVETSLGYHGDDLVTFIGLAVNSDNFTMFSQPIRLHVYTLYSPCGHYGLCTSEDDPSCKDNRRSQSFESYSCTCDNWHNGSWCDILDVLKITLITVGSCWIIVLATIGLLKFRDSIHNLNKVHPMDEIVELDDLEGSDIEKESNPEDDDSDGDISELEVEPVAAPMYAHDAAAPARYQREFRVEAKRVWMEPGTDITAADAAVTGKAKPPKKTKKTKKTKKVKKSKVSPRETQA